MRASLTLTLATVVAVVAPAAAAEPGVPPWFDWVKSNPEAAKWVTTNSVEVNWAPRYAPHYMNWVRAAKYILYVFPKKHPTRNIDYVAACHEVYNVWAGSDTALIDELKRTDVDSLPLFGQVNWSKDGSVSEGTFYDWVKSGWQWGWRYACDWQPWKESELMKAAVRIAYWVASWVPYPKKREWWYYGYRNHWGGGPQCILRDPDNWEFNSGHGWNCCDHAALAVALMRAAGIPARPVLGGPNGNDHVWVEVLNVDGKWVPVDPTGDAGAWYCRPRWRQGWIKDDDYEHGVQHYAISISDLEDAWKRLYTRPGSRQANLLVTMALLVLLGILLLNPSERPLTSTLPPTPSASPVSSCVKRVKRA